MPVRLITPPASEPVTLAEAKTQLRLEESLDDEFVLGLIATARAFVEQAAWRGLVTQTWELVKGSFAGEDTLELGFRGRRFLGENTGLVNVGPGSLPWIELPKGNLGTVTSIKYIDPTGVEQTLASTEYTADAASEPGRIRLAYGKAWPQTREQWDAVVIRYTVGWAVTTNVWAGPAPLKQAVLLMLSALYEGRAPAVVEPGSTLDMMISPYRLFRL